jgi:anti-anti-sigma regulatory factor
MSSLGFSYGLTSVKGSLMLTLPSSISDDFIEQIKVLVANEAKKKRSRAVIFDFSATKIMDCSEFIDLKDIANALQLIGVVPLFVSLSPGIVVHLINNDIFFSEISTLINIEAAYDYLDKLYGK